MKITAIVTIEVPASAEAMEQTKTRRAEMEDAGEGRYFHRLLVDKWVADADQKLPRAVSAMQMSMKGWKQSREDVAIMSGGPDDAPYHQFQTYWVRLTA